MPLTLGADLKHMATAIGNAETLVKNEYTQLASTYPSAHSTLDSLGLYRPEFERDNCGFGLIAQMDGKPSNWLVRTAIESLNRMTHRGAIAADGKSGDGCGLLMKRPEGFLRAVASELGFALNDTFAAGMVFLNADNALANKARATLENALRAQGVEVLGWRIVPTDPNACGEHALAVLPQIEQIFVNAPADMDAVHFERALFIARRQTEKQIEPNDPAFYIPSLSARVLSYKGLVMPEYLPVFYPDLQDERFESALCVYHQRFATNTLPQWRLAQPFRQLAHNGEINTVAGNRNWSVARSMKFETPLIPDMDAVRPLVSMSGSDSNSLDNMLEALLMGGMDIFRAMRLLIPPAWQNIESMDPDLRAFHEYNSMHMEPWDGPAGIVLTDGRYAACTMDRNGLRPARWVITKDRHITLASEIGVYDYDSDQVVRKGRLRPGQMIAVDTETGALVLPEQIDQDLKQRQPYKQWLETYTRHLATAIKDDEPSAPELAHSELEVAQKLFQITFEERQEVLKVLASDGQEAIGSMGDDTPIAVLSQHRRSLYDYFRQQFAQVTNPPIDPLREQIVMSLETCLGRELNLFEETADHAKRLIIDSPVLSRGKFSALLETHTNDYPHQVLDLGYDPSGSLHGAIKQLCKDAEDAVGAGKVLLVLSDRAMQANRPQVHALLATGAVHHHLVRTGLRCDANLIIDTATARDPHQFATLIGYGATAVHPWLAYEVLHDLIAQDDLRNITASDAAALYRKGINKGLYKILSKMGISAVASYRGAQLFEAVGLHREVVDLCFKGTTCRIQGSRFADLENDQRVLMREAWNQRKPIRQGGLLKFLHGGEYHAYNPDVVQSLQKAVQSGEMNDYRVFAKHVNGRGVAALRDLFALSDKTQAIPLDQVEPWENIAKRFDTAAMSLGALSPEAHEALAIAMNTLGGRSNSGEGGEDPARYGTNKVSKIKQIASGRFGVTPHYLVNAEVLQIKVAQGAKPGEGGQLPGNKVNDLIARLRFCNPGTTLVSPPPHHDIYSIEDLAQLIFDLKQVNPDALVSVKLVAEAGVGTIAAGVAKAYADLITIAGHDGGTGASPLTSVKYAGSPWELGLSETHQILRANDLRGRVRLQTDGGLKTGLDVVKAAMLGAESFGFGTGPMVALGCKYLRICHLNNCATGVATQNATLREKHFKGLPEMVINYFRFVAEEAREWMAQLGIRSFDELVGRSDLLEAATGLSDKQSNLDLSPILRGHGNIPADKPHTVQDARNVPFDTAELAEQMVRDCLPAIENKRGGSFSYQVRNTDRSIGARLSGEIAKRHGNLGMESTPLEIALQGNVGQSFGVWNAGGLHLTLEGDANDYVGKGMAGGRLVLHPPKNAAYRSHETPIMGNTCLYGATGGELFAAGTAGERFGVRNSGATTVVEGVGDHGCEYMTGGIVAVLGSTGLNFGAAMTGGLAYVLDMEQAFVDRYNHELVDIHRLTPEPMQPYRDHLLSLIERHAALTGSAWSRKIANEFADFSGLFWLVKPKALELADLLATQTRAA